MHPRYQVTAMTTPSASVLQRELETFERVKDQLLAHSEGKFVLIHDDDVLGTYNDEKDAIADGYRRLGNVPFLVRLITEVEVPANFVNGNVGL
jgi:hypothetical protein